MSHTAGKKIGRGALSFLALFCLLWLTACGTSTRPAEAPLTGDEALMPQVRTGIVGVDFDAFGNPLYPFDGEIFLTLEGHRLAVDENIYYCSRYAANDLEAAIREGDEDVYDPVNDPLLLEIEVLAKANRECPPSDEEYPRVHPVSLEGSIELSNEQLEKLLRDKYYLIIDYFGIAAVGQIIGSMSTPDVSIDEVLAAFNGFAGSSPPTLVGSGPGRSAANRLNAFRNKLISAGDLLGSSEILGACTQLADAQKHIHIDGSLHPSHFITGSSAPTLYALIRDLRNDLSCS